MNINFEQYKMFYYVALTGSISKGAKKMMISQPAVTQSIKSLEEQLGGNLFIRTPKGVVLTNEGKILYNYIKEGITYFINGTNKFLGLKELNEGVINIGCSTTASNYILMPYITIFHNLYPNVIINITNELTEKLYSDLRNGNLDIILVALSNSKVNDIEEYKILELHDVFISNKPIKKLKINEVLNEGIIIQKSPANIRINFDNFIKDNNLKYNIKMEIVSHNLLINFVKNNFGIGLATKEFVDETYIVNTDINIPSRSFGYCLKKGNIPSFSTNKFIEILKNNMNNL